MKRPIFSIIIIVLLMMTVLVSAAGVFRVNRNGTITDIRTRLMWQQDANDMELYNWQGAVEYCKKLRLAGYSNWRLPTIDELRKLINENQDDQHKWLNTQGFKNIQPSIYWSSTTYTENDSFALYVGMSYGVVYRRPKNSHYYVRAVRNAR